MQIPEHMWPAVDETLSMSNRAAYLAMLWSTVLRLVPFRDGNQWCVLYGQNIQDGIAGFGPSPQQAMIAFDAEFCKSNEQS